MAGFMFAFLTILIILLVRKLIQPRINPYRFGLIQAWSKAGGFHNYNGYPVFYYDSIRFDHECQSKSILVLLHGYPTSSIDWYYVRRDLEKRFRLIAPDYLGYGLSAKPIDFPYTIKEQVNMLEELFESLNIERYDIMAHDVGVSVAQELLARQVEQNQRRIRSVVLLNGGLFPESHRPFFTMKLLKIPILGACLQNFVPKSVFGKTFNRVFGLKTKCSQTKLDEITDLLFYNAPYDLLQRLQCYLNERNTHRVRWTNALNDVQTRCGTRLRMINGPYDPISGRHMYERYCKIVAQPDACLLPDHIGHYPHIEDPQGTLKYFFEFHDQLNTL